MVIQQPQYTLAADPTVWTSYDWSCRINGNETDDPEASLTVDGGSHPGGVDLLDGMTVLISSVAYGHWDSAVCHVRGDQHVDNTTVSLDISTSSEVRGHVSNDDYLVVLDEFRLRQRYGRIEVVGGEIVWYKDWDIEWDDLGANDPARRLAMMPPVPIMGPHAVEFVDIGGASADFYFDWSDSYAPAVGETVDSWESWGETDHAGGTWTYNADAIPGWQTTDAISGLRGFRVVLEVDDGNGNATTLPYRRGVRYVFSLRRPGETQDGDPENAEPLTEFELAEPVAGSFEQGYWRTRVTVFADEASKYNIMPEALVVLFTEDTYTSDCDPLKRSVGAVNHRENILLVGRIINDTIRVDPETGDVTFDVASPGAEAAMYHNYPIVIQNDDAGTSWIDTPDLTVDRAVRYYIAWHTTLSLIADVYQTDDTKEIYAQDFLEGDIYSTLDGFLHDRLFARLLCDKYGRFFCEVDAQEQAFGTVTTLFTMMDGDWLDEVDVRQFNQSRVNAVECGGLIYAAGTVTPKLSRAPGLYDRYRGSRQEATSLAIASQNALNTTCGRHLNALNYEFEADFQLAGNWRYCDIAPQRVMNIGTLVTPRQDLTGNYIIRAVTNTYMPEQGCIFTDIQTEQEMDDGVAGVTIVIPDEMPDVVYEPEYPEGFGGVEPLGEVPQEPPANAPSGLGYWYACDPGDANDYWDEAHAPAGAPAFGSWTAVASDTSIYKTCYMYSATTGRFFGYGWDGIWEYSPLPMGTGAWAQLYTDAEIATLLGHGGDFTDVYISRMEFSVKPTRDGWGWATGIMYYVDGEADEHMVLFCLHTRNGWDGVVYATTVLDAEEDVDYDYWISWEPGLAIDMHSDTVYILEAHPPEESGGIPTYSGWWRLYRSQDFGQTFALAQEETFVWGVDGYGLQNPDEEFCDVWVPWKSNSYQGGTVFWTTTVLQSTDIWMEYLIVPKIYRSQNHGLSYEDIGDDGGDLTSGLNRLGGPWNSTERVYGSVSMRMSADADQLRAYMWKEGSGWTLIRATTRAGNFWDSLCWVIMEQDGYDLDKYLAYGQPYYVNAGAGTDVDVGPGLAPGGDINIYWLTYIPA
ncbi:MAG: hypothetical protein KKC55_15065 [Gammaproteobacteria bacterium]|nr:hypothetical protein [Gammaproteobacteria bacterium]